MDYTFILTTYNQEKYVVQALESIKYQIETYGMNYEIQLIIGDDASKDKTTEIIDRWLEKNGKLFSAINRFYFKENGGTCHNYVNSMRHIQGKYFREMAGDDILPVNNIFHIMDMTKEYDIVTSALFPFQKDKIITQPVAYRSIFRQSIFSVKQLSILVQLSCPILNGVIWKKELMTQEVLNYIAKYTLVEDRPQWYKIFKENKQLRYNFCDKVSLLYRQEEGTVSRSKSQIRQIYEDDMRKIYQDIEAETASKFVKLVLWWNGHLNRLNPLNIWMKCIMLVNYRNVQRKYRKLMEQQLEQNQAYLNYIIKISDEFMKDVKLNE